MKRKFVALVEVSERSGGVNSRSFTGCRATMVSSIKSYDNMICKQAKRFNAILRRSRLTANSIVCVALLFTLLALVDFRFNLFSNPSNEFESKKNKLKTFFSSDSRIFSALMTQHLTTLKIIFWCLFFPNLRTTVNSFENNFTHELTLLAFRLTSSLW